MKTILLALALCIGLHSFAQKKDKPNENTKFLYKEASIETDDYSIYIVDVISNAKQAKFKIKIFNKTNDYLLIKPNEFKFVSGDKTIISLDKTYVVAPNEEESKVLDFKGSDMLVEKYTLECYGIYKASAGGKVYPISNFELPASKNEIISNGFTCTLLKSELNTDKSVAKYECAYTGDGVGIINPSKASAIMPNGQENVNSKKNHPMVLEKGKKDDFTLVFNEVNGAGDMQKKGIQIKWNDTFRESKLKAIGNSKLELIKESEKK